MERKLRENAEKDSSKTKMAKVYTKKKKKKSTNSMETLRRLIIKISLRRFIISYADIATIVVQQFCTVNIGAFFSLALLILP